MVLHVMQFALESNSSGATRNFIQFLDDALGQHSFKINELNLFGDGLVILLVISDKKKTSNKPQSKFCDKQEGVEMYYSQTVFTPGASSLELESGQSTF